MIVSSGIKVKPALVKPWISTTKNWGFEFMDAFRVMEYGIFFTPLGFQDFAVISEIIKIPRNLDLCGYRAISESFHSHFTTTSLHFGDVVSYTGRFLCLLG